MFFKLFQESGRSQQRSAVIKSAANNSIFDDFPEAYYEVDLKGNFTYANTALYALQGPDAESLLGKNFRRFSSTALAQRVIEIAYNVYCTATSARISDFQWIGPDGQSKVIDLSIALVSDDCGEPKGFRGIARDLTGDTSASHRDQERYRNFVESIEDGCFEVDLDGTMIFINEAMCKIHGYQSKELLGMNHRSFASREDAKNIFHTFNKVYKTGQPFTILDYTIIHKDGTPRYLEVSASLIRDDKGAPIGFRGITRDRTEKRIKEMELLRYKDFVENVDDACFEVDLGGNMTFFNNATVNNFGYPADQLMGMNNRQYTTPEMAKKIYAIYNQIYKTGQPRKLADYEIIDSQGKTRYLDTTASLITNAKGEPIGFRGISRDMTEQRKSAHDSERLAQMVGQIQRLEAVSTLAAGVAHNFNNLLMSIQGYVSIMAMDLGLAHPQLERLKAIEKNIHKGSQLTQQLLNYASTDQHVAAPADLNKIVKEAVARFRTSTKTAAIKEGYGESLPLAVVDRDQMAHVMANLLTNAEQAMPDGGTITIQTEAVHLGEEFVRSHGCQAGNYIKISLRDTGVGMAPETLQRIFEPFFTTKKLGMAGGLGLASAYGIVKGHGGFIEVQSKLNAGTTFNIFLPVVSKEEVKAVQKSAAEVKPSVRPTILLVDDERITLEMMTKWLTKKGFNIIKGSTGEEALEIFQARHATIDLVIMDVVMPGMGGDEALGKMEQIDPNVKAILVSGFIDGSQMEGIIRNNRQAFFQKPIEYNALSESIQNLLAKK